MRGRPSADVRDRIRGQKGTIVKLTVESAATGKREMVELTRDAVAQPSISDSYLIKPGIGYIAMNGGFNYTTADEFNSAVDDLHGKGMNQLILDLRNNPGGLLDQAKRVAERFLPRGEVILSQKGRMPNSDHVYRSETRTPDDEPLVLLVNRGTASASEIFAGAMQDHDRAILIGETTFGKGLVQSIIPLEYGSALTLTSSKYLLPSGRLIQRDYSTGNLYDYYLRGINRQDDESKKSQSAPVEQPTGAESHTDTGRPVFGGGGIVPDVNIKPQIFTPAQVRLIDPIFAFVRELVNGRIAGFDSYRVQGGIDFGHDLQASDFPVTDAVYKAFKDYVASQPAYKASAAQLDRNADFIRLQMRYDMTTAAYGTAKATRVLIAGDPQAMKALDVLPRARELAATAMRGRNPQQKSF